jgi:hypothetical protein
MAGAEAIRHIFSREYSLYQRIPNISVGTNHRGKEMADHQSGNQKPGRATPQDLDDMLRLAATGSEEGRRELAEAIIKERDARKRRRSLRRQTAAGLIAGGALICGVAYYGVNDPPRMAQQNAPRYSSAVTSADSDDNDKIVLRAMSDGAKTTIVIPDKPAGKASDPSGIYEDIAPMAFSLEDQGIKDLVSTTDDESSVSNIFREIATKTAEGDALSGTADQGALVMAVWHMREHPGSSLHEAAMSLNKDMPDVETFKTAVVVASDMLTDIGKKSSTDNRFVPGGRPANDARRGAEHCTPVPVGSPTGNMLVPVGCSNTETGKAISPNDDDPAAVVNRGMQALHAAGVIDARSSAPDNGVFENATALDDKTVDISNPHPGMGREALNNLLQKCLHKDTVPSNAVVNGVVTTIAYSSYVLAVQTKLRKTLPNASYLMAVAATNGQLPTGPVGVGYWKRAMQLVANTVNKEHGGWCTVHDTSKE